MTPATTNPATDLAAQPARARKAWDTQTGNVARAKAAAARRERAKTTAADVAGAPAMAREGADPLGLWATITRGQWEAMDQTDRHLITLVDRPRGVAKAVRAWLVDLDHVAAVAKVEPTEALLRLRRMQSDGLLGVMVSNRSCRDWRAEIMVAIARPGDDDHLCIAAVRGEPSRFGAAGTWDPASPLPIPKGQGYHPRDGRRNDPIDRVEPIGGAA